MLDLIVQSMYGRMYTPKYVRADYLLLTCFFVKYFVFIQTLLLPYTLNYILVGIKLQTDTINR